MTLSRPLAWPLARSIARPLAGLGSGGAFSLSDLDPALWLEADSGAVTGGSRKFTAGDKADFQIADASQSGLDPGTGDFTLSLWFNKDGNRLQTLVRKGLVPGYWVFVNSSGNVVVRFSDGGTFLEGVSTSSVSSDAWHFLEAKFDRDGNAVVYVDGSAIVTLAISTQQGAVNSTSAFILGNDGSGYFGGKIALISFWNRLTTADESAYLYARGDARDYSELGVAGTDGADLLTNLVSFWPCNETSASSGLLDAHGSNDLTFTNTELITNGGFETAGAGGADVFANWTESPTGSSTVNDETVIVDSGGHSCRLDGDASNSIVSITQSNIITSGNSYAYSVRARASVDFRTIRIDGLGSPILDLTTTFATYAGTLAANSTSIGIVRQSLTSASAYVDSVSVKAAGIPAANGPNVATASDSIGTNHGTLVGFSDAQQITAWSNDVPDAVGEGGSLLFDGTDDEVSMPTAVNTAIVNGASKLTIAAWVKLSSLTGRHPFASNYTSSNGVILEWDSTAGWRMYANNAGLNFGITGTTGFVTGVWYHVAYVFDGTATGNSNRLKLFIDGQQQSLTFTGTIPSTLGTATAPFTLGGATLGRLSGRMHDTRIYGGIALSQAQVAELVAGSEATGATPLAHWTFDDGPQTGGISNGDPVVTWIDRSAGALASQATAAKRFTYETDSINGHPAMLFDGVDDFLSIPLNLSDATGLSVYVVLKSSDGDLDNMVVELTSNAGGTAGGFYISARGSALADNAALRGMTSGVPIPDTPADLTTGAARIVELHSNLANSHRLVVDGTGGTEDTTAMTGSGLANSTLYIGMRAGTSLPYSGRIAVILICPTLNSDADKAKARQLIATKYGISL